MGRSFRDLSWCVGGGLAVLSVCLGAGCGDILRLGTRRDRGPWPLIFASFLACGCPGRGFRDFSVVRWLGDGWGVHAKAGHSQGCPRSLRVFLIVSAQAEASAIFRWGGEAGLAVLPALVLRGDDMLRLGTRSVRGPWPPIVASFLARGCPDRGFRDLSVVRWGRVCSLVCFGRNFNELET